ncbi:FAD-binding protein [Orrella sp. JC864]|uniref:FAD-binding protein n=1 Tax=Orrella sp. JC864 TaxID=3120298 RepID=UPI0012BC3638
MQPTRRAFLIGRRPRPDDAWTRLLAALRRVCEGELETAGLPPGQARYAPARAADVRLARTLCAEHGVRLGLAGLRPLPQADPAPTLWVDPGVSLTGLAPVDAGPGLWRAEAGCPLGALQAAGFAQFDGLPAGQTLAAWLSGEDTRRLCAPGRCMDSGVQAVAALLADGTPATLGPFGERDRQPLRGAALQRLVPALFELAMGQDAQLCLAQPAWPAHGRLDALRPAPPAGVNLAHLLLGQAGSLAWVEAALLQPCRGGPAVAATQHENAPVQAAASRMNAACKRLFDPAGLFPPLPARSS